MTFGNKENSMIEDLNGVFPHVETSKKLNLSKKSKKLKKYFLRFLAPEGCPKRGP